MRLRGVGPRPEVQLAISRCFGALEHHPVKEVWVDGHPELIALDTAPAGCPGMPICSPGRGSIAAAYCAR